MQETNEQRVAREEREAGGDLKWLMEQKRGRRIVRRLLEETGVHRSTFNTSGSVMAFNEGRRNVGLKLMAQILEFAPGTYALLLEEQNR